LTKQLKEGGRIFVPIGRAGGFQSVYIIDKDEQGKLTEQVLMDVSYVPLTSLENQLAEL
jgi:protein-L-isoaspartate(D-aspartate) O-methyltransferase